MGPLFSAILVTLASGVLFSVTFIVFRFFLSTSIAVRGAFGFVIGAGVSAALAVGLLAMVIGVGTKLVTTLQVIAYLSTVAISAVLGGAVLSRQLVRKFRAR
jgi:hypothetical protein